MSPSLSVRAKDSYGSPLRWILRMQRKLAQSHQDREDGRIFEHLVEPHVSLA